MIMFSSVYHLPLSNEFVVVTKQRCLSKKNIVHDYHVIDAIRFGSHVLMGLLIDYH